MLSIVCKHKQQLLNLKKQLMVMNTVLTDKISIFERKLAYQGFLQDLMLIVLDLRHTVDKIFSHVDAAEKNQLGALARDTEFLRAVAKLMQDDNTPSSLYLMKLGAKVKVEACGLHIQIFYKFPVLVTGNFEPWRVVSIPKEIKSKFFELSNIPFLVTWNTNIYSYTESEHNECETKNMHMFCKMPGSVETPQVSCFYGLLKAISWSNLAELCELSLVEEPKENFVFTDSHIIFSNVIKKMVTMVCPGLHPHAGAKPIFLEGSRVLTVPLGCRVNLGGRQTVTMGHVARSATIGYSMNNRIWKLNMTRYIPSLKVSNVPNLTSLWDDSKEQKVIEEQLKETYELLNYMEFSPKGVTMTLLTLIGYVIIATVVVIVALVFACNPMMAKTYRCCDRCRKVKAREIKAPE